MEDVKLANKIKRILSDKRLSSLKSMLEKDHAIDCIFLLYLDKGHWKDALLFMQNLKLPLGYRSLQSRMKELVELGLAKSVSIDLYRKYYVKTELGEKIARLLLKFFMEMAE